MNRFPFIVVVPLLAVLAGCSTPEQFKGVEIGENPTLITSIPPLLQTKHVSCGPTCVAAVAAYWGKDYSSLITPSEPYYAEDFNARDLTNLVQRLELKSFIYSGSMTNLEDQIRNGRPVIVLVPRPDYKRSPNVTFNGVPMDGLGDVFGPNYSHWLIVIGFTDDKMILQDPAAGRMMVTRSKFENWWAAKRRTCLLITP